MTEELTFQSNIWTPHRCEEAALALCIAVNVPTIIWGPPGVGKTQTIRHIADAYQMHLVISILSASDMTDLQGYPVLEDGVSKLAPRKWVQDVINASEGKLANPKLDGGIDARKRPSIVFWDEISTAPPSTQAPALTIILDKLAGDTQMPMSTRMIGAANPPDIAANGWELSAPMANRFTHIDWNVDVETAVRGFQIGWDSPAIPALPKAKNFNQHVKNTKIIIGSFMRKNPSAIGYDFSQWGTNNDVFRASQNAFPSLRAWDTVAKLYAAAKTARYDGAPVDDEVMRILIAGTIGDATAHEFLHYTRNLNLADPKDIINAPSRVEVPVALDVLSATLSSLRIFCLAQAKEDMYPEVWDRWGYYLMRVVDAGAADVAFTHVREWWSARPANHAPREEVIQKIKPFIDQFGAV